MANGTTEYKHVQEPDPHRGWWEQIKEVRTVAAIASALANIGRLLLIFHDR